MDENREVSVATEVAAEELRLELEDWRRTRRRGSRIPGELWTRAVELATREGTLKTARRLGLDYLSLKKRRMLLDAEPPGRCSEAESPAATFVELLAPLGGTIAECALEVLSTQGARLRVEMKNVPPLGLASILRGFAG
jgi:hypothetical protein